jgi:LDH2 family malate/lactate/ureidoglycolate dehydrogenase
VLAALIPGAGLGPDTDALAGNGQPGGRDDDIGYFVAAIAPGALRSSGEVRRDAQTLFGTLLACPAVCDDSPVRYAGWHEAERARIHRRDGVALTEALYQELCEIAGKLKIRVPAPIGAC